MSFEDTYHVPNMPQQPLYDRDFRNAVLSPESLAAQKAREESEIDLFKDELDNLDYNNVEYLNNRAVDEATPGHIAEVQPEAEMAAEAAPFDAAHIRGVGKILVQDMRRQYTQYTRAA